MSKNKLKIIVAKNIKKHRQKLKLTQEQAAELTGFHYKYFQKIEAGQVNLTLSSIEKIVLAFRIKVTDILK